MSSATRILGRRRVVDAITALSVAVATQEGARRRGSCTPSPARSAGPGGSLPVIGGRRVVQDS